MKKHPRKRTLAKDGTESDLERLFLTYWNSHYPTHPPVTQYKFHSRYKWQFDFAFPSHELAVEIQGYGPGHFSVPGMTQDCIKNINALLLGWRIIYLTSTLISPENLGWVTRNIADLLVIPKPPLIPAPKGYVPLHRRKT